MEQSNIIYKICLLNSDGDVYSMIVFKGSDNPPENLSEIFSEDDVILINSGQINVVYSKQQIHKDDSIRIIKKKILYEFKQLALSYEEIYLFAIKLDRLHLLKTYQEITKNEQREFTKDMVGQLLSNLQIRNMDTLEAFEKVEKTTFSYHDFMKEFSEKDGNYNIPIPLGRKFISYRDLLFSGNPFHILRSGKPAFEQNLDNNLAVFDNHVLLNYGDINDKIYLCSAKEVLEFAIKENIDEQYVVQLYYPFLDKKEIVNQQLLLESSEELIDDTKKLLKDKTAKLYEIVDTFYNIYANRGEHELPYREQGVKSFGITLRAEFPVILPLEIIFKQLHASREMPYIKYNPGIRREHIYRLYSTKRTKNGKKIPFLSRGVINSLSKQSGKSRQLSIYVQHIHNETNVNMFLNFNLNGHVELRSELNAPIRIEEIEQIILDVINPIIQRVNGLLEPVGYKVDLFTSLKDDLVDISDIKYVCSIPYEKQIALNDYANLLSCAFDVIHKDIGKGAELLFKRVENYRKMDAMAAMITRTWTKTNNERAVIESLIENFSLSEDEALANVVKFLNEHTQFQGKLVNKSKDVSENPGFPVFISTIPVENLLVVEVSDINALEYIEILHVYLDSFLRITQMPETLYIPKEKIMQMSSKVKNVTDVTHVEDVIVPKVNVMAPIQSKFIEEETIDEENIDELEEGGILFDEEDDEDGGILFEEDDDENEDEENMGDGSIQTGGAPKINFFKKMKEREPTLFYSKKTGNYNAYTRSCPKNYNRQPVILSDEEKRKIDSEYPGSYEVALPYGTNPNKKFWYICPRYWCLKTNSPMTKEQVDNNECGGGKIISEEKGNAKGPEEGHFIYEFTDKKEHIDKDGNYRQHRPGFLGKDKHPTSCLPCCFKNMNSEHQITRRKECGVQDGNLSGNDPALISRLIRSNLAKKDEDEEKQGDGEEDAEAGGEPKEKKPRKKKESKKSVAEAEQIVNVSYIINMEKTVIPQHRWGFLPLAVELFLHTDISKSVDKRNVSVVKKNEAPLLRYGVELSHHQSFIACIADVFTFFNNEPVPSIDQMRNKIADALTLDVFLRAQNGTLVSTFQPKKRDVTDTETEEYKDQQFYKSFSDLGNDSQRNFLKDTIAAYKNFIKYIRDKDSFIDYTYLWDIITSGETVFKQKLNLIIIEIVDNDNTENINIVCPTNSKNDNVYDLKNDTVILLKQNDFYQPIYKYGVTANNKVNNTTNVAMKVFNRSNSPRSLIEVIQSIKKNTGKYCKSYPSKPNVYKYKENLPAKTIYDTLSAHNYAIQSQVMNYRGKIIAFMVLEQKDATNPIYVPCYPSGSLPNVPIIYADDVKWNSYEDTRDKLLLISAITDGKVLSKPIRKVIEDELIVGILTETNQFIQIFPYEQNIIQDDIKEEHVSNYKDNLYYDADKTLALSSDPDMARIKTVQKITLETQFYNSFRSKIRILLNDYMNKDVREKVEEIIKSSELYRIKIKKLALLLKYLLRNHVSFEEISEEILMTLYKTSAIDQGKKNYCLSKKNKLCLPKLHLVSGSENETVYFGRIADELLRYNRIRIFMLEPKKYLNISNVDYKVNDDEVILLQSVLFGDYFNNLVEFPMNDYIQNINYDAANPEKTQYVSNKVAINEQNALNIKTTDIQEFNAECINKTGEVLEIGNKNWKPTFPPETKETFLNTGPLCSFYIIKYILKEKSGLDESVESIKNYLLEAYRTYLSSYTQQIFNVLKDQGKISMIKKIEKKIIEFDTMIISEDYCLTTLDVWLLATKLNLPIVLIAHDKLTNLVRNLDWLVLGGNPDLDSYYFVRCSGKKLLDSECETYSMILPPIQLNALVGYSEMKLAPDHFTHLQMFDDFIQNYNRIKIKMTAPAP